LAFRLGGWGRESAWHRRLSVFRYALTTRRALSRASGHGKPCPQSCEPRFARLAVVSPWIRATQFLQPLTYLDIGVATRITRELVGKFFDRMLLGVATANPQDVAFDAPDVLTVEHRTP
jgi:hypothetical protein